MKKILTFILIMLTLSINTYILKADCKDITKEISNVKSEMLKINTDDELTINMKISNLTENLYVVVMNDYDNSTNTYHYSNFKDNTLDIYTANTLVKINYVIKVYSEDTTCGVEPLKTINYTTPRFNEFSTYNRCNDYKDLEICDVFYDTKEMTYDEYVKKVEKEIKKLEDSNHTFVYYILKYCLFVIIPILLIAAIYVVRIIILKRGKSKNA